MQDYLYVNTKQMEDKIRNENKSLKLSVEKMNTKIEESTNEIIQEFLQTDIKKWQNDILHNNGYNFSIAEMNFIHYLYKENNTLVHFVNYFFKSNSNPICYDIEAFYTLLKEMKRNILFKITNIKKAKMLDDEILVLNKNKTFSNKLKNDGIYQINQDNKLILNVKKTLF